MRKATPEDIARYVEAQDRLSEMEGELKDIKKKSFLVRSNELFAAHPALKQFGWNQFTPGFNDGEPCVFEVNSDYCVVNERTEDGELADHARAAEKTRQKWAGWAEDTYDEWDSLRSVVAEFIASHRNDDLEEIFGDGVSVSITPNKIAIQEYNNGY